MICHSPLGATALQRAENIISQTDVNTQIVLLFASCSLKRLQENLIYSCGKRVTIKRRKMRKHLVFTFLFFAVLLVSWTIIPTSQVATASPKVNPKKGVAYWDSPNPSANDLAAVGATWYYSWWYTPSLYSGYEAVPMVVCGYVPSTLGGNSPYVLGANEPDVTGQCNMTPTQYITTWHQIETTYWPTKTLISPATTGFGNANIQWLIVFRDEYSTTYGYYPHWGYVAAHCYEETAAGCESTIGEVADLASSWGASGVWVTEFALGHQKSDGCAAVTTPTPSPTRTPFPNEWRQYFPLVSSNSCVETNTAEMDTLLTWLDGNSSVFRYAWFALKYPNGCAPNCATSRTGLVWNSSLIDWWSNALTPGGQVYANH